jgi:transcriptional regulator with XRE-family HTH domain
MQDTCPSTAKNSHIYVRTLHDACKRLGGERKLADYLGVDARTISDWLNGVGHPSDSIFLRCVDVLHNAA